MDSCACESWETCVAISAMAGAFYLDGRRLDAIANDPWDPLYQVPYDPTFNWFVVPWFQQLPEDGSAGPWDMAPYINNYVYSATVIDGLLDMACVSANRISGADIAG
jgi:hypothetical protein